MDNGTTGRFSRGPRSILDLGYAAGCVAAELRDYCRAAFLGRQFLPVISVTDTRRQGVRIPALGSLPNLRRHFTLTARSRLSRGRFQGNVSTAIEWPAPKGLAQLKLGPANNIVSSRATRSLMAEAICSVTQVRVGTKNHFHTDEKPTEAWIPEHFADQRLLTPFLAFLSGIRTLVAGLIFVALIPNLTLGAIFWLGAINATLSPATHPNESSGPAAQSAVPSPVLSSPAMLEATAGGDIAFPIALDGTDGVPARSIIAIRGLPQGSKLSSGRA